MKMEKQLKRKNIPSLFVVIFIAFIGFALIACESPRVIKHPVSNGDTYYYYVTFYGDDYNGKNMANGEPFSNEAMTCAAKGFPFGTVLEVQSLDTGNKVEVTVTDIPGEEVIDLTKKAFDSIDNAAKGKIRAKIKVVGFSESAQKAAPEAEPEKSAEEEQKEPEKEVPEEVKKETFYAVTLAAFGDIEAAKAFQSGIKEETYIFTQDGKFEVRYGKYASKEEAKSDVERFEWKDAEIVIIEE
jgi:rare lipoprotein A